MQSAVAYVDHEVTMKVKVTRKDGTEEIYDGDPVKISIPEELVNEYKDTVAKLRFLEEEIFKYLK